MRREPFDVSELLVELLAPEKERAQHRMRRRPIFVGVSSRLGLLPRRVDMAATARVNHPYFFANLKNGGPLVNRYMPRVYPAYAESV